MNKQEIIERLNNKLDETFAFQRSFKPLTWTHMEYESKANAYMTAINYVEQLDESEENLASTIKLLTNLDTDDFLKELKLYGLAKEPQKVKVPAFVAEWFEMNKKNIEYRIWKYIKNWDDQRWDDFKNWMDKNSVKSLEILTKMQYGYEVEEEPKYRVKVGNGYFINYQGRGCLISPHEKDGIMNFDSMKEANRTADTVGGTVEKV
ncbi:DUF1642 domain-containing protein [Enterococcus gilvus]|uniref:DUF1642 domain-containing protein n=2 Tax=Enterococcus gilvus TaxID=160453 RepID=R2VI37_9ENTE|nr:DUF1642 domain-containing protein [Enterococcus gilvus]EOI57311.1 hypothetical protein UKC_01525 [Enterococcus gilvus ATCC BAA-350]EOW83115.1 hypothetical protein I592_02442 [Enterococcus gilvus ATCC BAA-350]OJG40367.1 hypothetical protein RV02_GL002455 [Enterococcus gilvus]